MGLAGGNPPIQEIWMVSQISRGILGISRGIPREMAAGKLTGKFGWPAGKFPGKSPKFAGCPIRISREISRLALPGEFPGNFHG